jgi:heme-degrading monooxygenase HmoA
MGAFVGKVGYTYIWEFEVQPDSEAEFEQHYGPKGTWAKLFRQAPGYIETLLLQDKAEPLRYITVDRWRCEEDFHAFKKKFDREFAELDGECEMLTRNAAAIGWLTEIQ